MRSRLARVMAILAAAAGCGGSGSSDDEDAAGRSSGGADSGGASGSGGSSGAHPSGGQSSGGQSGSGGAGGTLVGGAGGTGVLDPPSPGVACGETTCDGATPWCCVDVDSSSCEASECTGLTYRMGCDDAVDCPGQHCCFADMFASVRFATDCTDECGAYSNETVVCKSASDCQNGEACHAYTCAGHVLGLCTATAPYFCE